MSHNNKNMTRKEERVKKEGWAKETLPTVSCEVWGAKTGIALMDKGKGEKECERNVKGILTQ